MLAMTEDGPYRLNSTSIAALICAVVLSYLAVLQKLGQDWWVDENYSHGLLVPIVIAFIVWNEWGRLKSTAGPGPRWLAVSLIIAAALMLLAGTLAAELFTQRISLVLMLAGIVVYLFGLKVLNILTVPFALLLLAIPIPQIVFNRIAFPLQIWASQTAVWGIRLFEVPTVRRGNVIDILPSGSTQTISLEVVEACSGIRSLMTLVTLALVLAYFTRRAPNGDIGGFTRSDLFRAVFLMVLAVPIAVLTNAARVTGTGFLTYYYGSQATEGTWHDLSGWLVYLAALVLLIGANVLLGKIFRTRGSYENERPEFPSRQSSANVWPLIICLAASGLMVQWFVNRSEVIPPRETLSALPIVLGEWRQRGDEIKFEESVEKVLKTTDYTMREYTQDNGRIANVYIGYYESQRSGATYHSPQNCLPGAGWIMKDPEYIEVTSPRGKVFRARKYIIQNGIYNEVMIYWYQGRGRFEGNEYNDKISTVLDSITKSRSDGAMVRIMTGVGNNETTAVQSASAFAGRLADELAPFIPE
jgi:exosortase D (VPLPA-CTERM-specific)